MAILPRSLRDHVDLVEAFDKLGRVLFLGSWNGAEISPPKWDTVLPPEKAAIQEEVDRLRCILAKRGHRYDDEYIRDIFRADEDCDVWIEAWQTRNRNDPGNWADVVSQLMNLIEVIAADNDWKADAVIHLKAVYARRQQLLTAMLTLLVDGKLVSFCEDRHVRTRIPPADWADRSLKVDIANSTVSRFLPGKIVFNAKDFARALQEITSPDGAHSKLEAASSAELELIRMMSDSTQQRRERKSVLDEFQTRWPTLSERDFNLRWKIACDETQSGWNRPGRFPTSARSST